MNREQILAALSDFVRQRPGLEFGNYGSMPAYRSEQRAIQRDFRDAQGLLAAVATRGDISAKDLVEATRAFSGRLQLVFPSPKQVHVTYVVGQYWPTEYRKAVCAVLAAALWAYWREYFDTGDEIRKMARNELSRGVAKRWFA